MSKWIDIDDISLLKTVSVGGLSAKALWKRIRQQPSIDLVRCAECKWFRRFDEGWNACEKHMIFMNPDDFCSYGDKRDD